ncbi:MAG TPA: LA2681 family HEPN domain-containing protein [Solirubrobacterales bacterium]|nr:LA2681 family HEPN domain-containing protein [Solirubrobacterales bacterium]
MLLADGLTGNDWAVRQLRAWTAAEVGADRDDIHLLEKAGQTWAELAKSKPDIPQLLYNQASTAEATFRAIVRTKGHAAALETQRHNLDLAREAYLKVGDDEEADDALRLQALTNLGNGFDMLGRDLESIEVYDKALAINPAFGMASGNKGVALAHVAHLADGHTSAVLSQAVEALDAALKDRDGIMAASGPSAYATFEATRGRIKITDTGDGDSPHKGHVHSSSPNPWNDPYLDWCRREKLFLHVSLECLREDDEFLDPLFFRRLISDISDAAGPDRIDVLHDAFNAIKQDFIAARYSAWLVSELDSPIRDQASSISARTRFVDSLSYARWGTRVGMGVQAFTAAANLLDKIASFTHLYLSTGRVRDVYFPSLWHPRNQKRKKQMEDAFRQEFEKESFNRGLLALCDLSCDLERKTRLAELIDRRHSATHRFLVVHEWGEDGAATGEFLDRVSWSELLDGLLWQLRTARAALIYLARAVEIRESRLGDEAESEGKVIPTMPAFGAMTEPAD